MRLKRRLRAQLISDIFGACVLFSGLTPHVMEYNPDRTETVSCHAALDFRFIFAYPQI